MPEHSPAPTPSRAVYGFGMFLCFKLLFITYILWAVVPEKYFIAMGITYMPNRYWAVAIPVLFLTFLALFAFVIYPSLGLLMTPSINDIRTIRDNVMCNTIVKNEQEAKQNFGGPCCTEKIKCRREQYESNLSRRFYRQQIAPLQDLSITEVSKKLYL